MALAVSLFMVYYKIFMQILYVIYYQHLQTQPFQVLIMMSNALVAIVTYSVRILVTESTIWE